MVLPELHIGTSGWSYKHWSGIFYPEGTKPDKYLEFYASRFGCVELNSCFYHLPLKSTVAGWTRRTGADFRFCPKLSRLITHQMKLSGIHEPLHNFFSVFEGMKDRLGPILIQLPPGLVYDRSLIVNFLDLLNEKHHQYRIAFEVRNPSWINDEFLDMLSNTGAGFVIADSGGRYPYSEAVTADFVYLRFHGREQLYASDYSLDDLKYFAQRISIWLGEEREVWVFFNNDFHGFAIKNASQLIELTGQI